MVIPLPPFISRFHDLAANLVPGSDGIAREVALALGKIKGRDAFSLLPLTSLMRRNLSGNKVMLCSIVNAKSGLCSEDCAFCAQSSAHKTGVKTHPLLPAEELIEAAKSARENGASEFSIVTSGKGITAAHEIDQVARAIEGIRKIGINPCVSPGMVSPETLDKWIDAGLSRYHHNLETSRSFFPQICTTHDYEEDVQAVRAAGEKGIKTCSGGIFGLGESFEERVELALLLRDLEVASIPVNFLNPIPGTPMAKKAPGIVPLEALLTIAMLRLVSPRARIIICGGREVNLRDLQALVFEAGANGLMIGNYLTTSGRDPKEDLQMIEDLGMEPGAL